MYEAISRPARESVNRHSDEMMFVTNMCFAIFMAVLLGISFSCIPTSESSGKPKPAKNDPGPHLETPMTYSQERTGLLSYADQRRSKPTIIPLETAVQTLWASKLQDILAKRMTFQSKFASTDIQQQSKQVTVVFGDAKYASSLFNWLVSALVVANPPLRNIIIISLDKELQALLDAKDIPSVHVIPESVTYRQVKRKTSQIWITRIVVYRLLNHWGYDVMAYDSDAIILRNMQDVLDTFSESDIIGSAGSYPFNLGTKWGQTICMGAALFKSTRKTGTTKQQFTY